MQEITIQLRVDFERDRKEECEAIMEDAAKTAAKHLLTTAAMIAGKRSPQVSLQVGDMFSTTKEIELANDLPGSYTDPQS